ncbi:hypothetical protein Ngar_c33410 [Candidatus Nitrososphaera gargensis Ga9.2]|uniref:Uncharacterized protein n=1 Tax=Nitrososphaera gargensis (strain Ga9.2) TaxID=1237085 RepID=K0IFT6_NITGG|nr:hypothetical protein Ngar_c33410 [Candidatus Nitrososphaera gargensis Ga9.2]
MATATAATWKTCLLFCHTKSLLQSKIVTKEHLDELMV